MIAIPAHLIAFFLAALLLPTGVRQFTLQMQDETIRWTREGVAWRAVEPPRDDLGLHSVSGTVVTVSGEGRQWNVDMARFVVAPAKSELTNSLEIALADESLGMPVVVRREDGRITLSQEEGAIFKRKATITWAPVIDLSGCPVIGRLVTAGKVITIRTGPAGPLFTVSSADGALLAAGLSSGELSDRFPDLKEVVEEGVADWAGIDPQYQAAPHPANLPSGRTPGASSSVIRIETPTAAGVNAP
jgi:hypothetical protein